MSHDALYERRHSLSHILAMAVLEVFPDAKLAIGPPIDDGFYYDFDLPRSLTPEDLPDLETRMRRLVATGVTFTRSEQAIAEARGSLENQPYKQELLDDLAQKGETAVSFYTSGTFTDLCKGPHVVSTSEIDPESFTLSRVAGAYWRGDEKRPMLQRIYGYAFLTKQELEDFLERLEQAKARDHRVLGPQLGIFHLSEAVGAGLPLWLPNGETVFHLLSEYMRRKEEKHGYQYVKSPVLAHENLYKRSGHAGHYDENMYSFVDDEGERFYLKPMNCPHHHVMMEQLVTSYRDLPLRLAEAGGVYRRERSGTLTGLIRVRGSITQNDSHIYCTPEQLEAELRGVLALFHEVYAELGFSDYWFRLSLPDFQKDKFEGESKIWDDAAQAIRRVLQEDGHHFVEAEGEAAFYGPKLDVQTRNVLGKEDTIATAQVDILVPGRMDLEYTAADGSKQHPIVIHRAILGSYERFIAMLLEQTAGNLPLWLAPVQVQLAAVSEQYVEGAENLAKELRALGLRVAVDASNESVGKKVRAAKLQKVPVTFVLGERELATKAQGWSLQANWRADLKGMPEQVSVSDLVPYFQVPA